MSPKDTVSASNGRPFNAGASRSLPIRPADHGSSQSSTSPPSKSAVRPRNALVTSTKPAKKILISPSKSHRNAPIATTRASTRTSLARRRAPPKAPQNLRTNLPLPIELRDQILTQLLTVAHSPVEYLSPKARRLRARCARADDRPIPPLPAHQVALRGVYLSLILTSKAVKADATRVLFYANEWLVRISLIRDLLPVGGGFFRGRNGTAELHRTFGDDAVGFVRDFKVRVASEDRAAEKNLKMYVGELVVALRASRTLRKLTVEWTNYYLIPSKFGPMRRKGTTRSVRLRRRAEDGSRRVMPHLEDWKMWEVDEMILSPFTGLRNVPEVHIVGSVSDEWVKYLEAVMMGPEGEVGEFVRVRTGGSLCRCDAPVMLTPLKQVFS